MERPTTTITTPLLKTEIVLKQWMTGGEYEYTQEPIFQGVSVRPSLAGGKPDADVTGFDSSSVRKSTHRVIETMVVSVAGKSEKTLEAVLDLPKEDYDFVLSEIDRLTKKKV